MKRMIIKLDKVSVNYNTGSFMSRKKKIRALQNVSMEINNGEIIGIIGANGSGKSTLLRVIARIIHPDSGTVWYSPGLLTSLLAIQVGFINDLSGKDNAIFSGMLMGMSKKDITSRLPDIRDLFGFPEFFEEKIDIYSTGMRARLGFAVAYHTNSDVFLLDEVLGVGDQSFRKTSQQLMLEKIKSGNAAVIISHNTDMLKRICDRVIWLKDGMIEEHGKADKVIQVYKNN